MNLEYSQEQKNKFEVGDLVCYSNSNRVRLCGIIVEISDMPKLLNEGNMVKIYWCIDKNDVDISPLSYPPIRKDGWVAAGLLMEIGNLKVVSKNT